MSTTGAGNYHHPPAPANFSEILPKDVRNIFSRGEYYGTTAGFCRGYVQANLVVVPSKDADHFDKFCEKNSAPCPLLYRSQPGDVGAPILAANSDVRSDLPRYVILSHGRQVDDMRDLLGFDWTDNVSFYLGCSFSFEDALIDNGIDLAYVKKSQNVAMYVSNIDCCDVDEKFSGTKMIVSMRPIKKDLLQKVVAITSCYPKAHGAPIHIGDPRRIIASLSEVDYGNTVSIGEDEVPVFWACGFTGRQAMESLKAKLSFTHYPGSMFITDVKAVPVELGAAEIPHTVCISPPRFPYHASLLSTERVERLKKLEEIILYDPGNCRVAELREDGDFLKSVLFLSHCRYVGVVFGFPCNLDFECKEETDGPPGALAIAKALQCLGKKAAIVSEERNREMIESCVQLMMAGNELVKDVKFVSCEELLQSDAIDDFDCLVAIERVGLAKDGGHYSMKGVDLTPLVDPIDQLFIQAGKSQSMGTIGIGDRGNELGLGRIKDKVMKVLPNGETIGCDVASDYVIMAGVSNWGGYAIAAGLYLLATCPIHRRYLNHGINGKEITDWNVNGFLQTNQSVKAVLKLMNDFGVRDGISKSLDQSVDGIPLKTHLQIIEKMRVLAN